jgi:hypothetical protein
MNLCHFSSNRWGSERLDASSVDGSPVDGSPVDGSPVDGSPVDGSPVDASSIDASPVCLCGEGMGRKEVKPFLLRIDPQVLAAIQRWAEDDLRSLNGQIEYLLRQALSKRGVKLVDDTATTTSSETNADD